LHTKERMKGEKENGNVEELLSRISVLALPSVGSARVPAKLLVCDLL